MKMRRTVVALFLMVAILTLGIGYAALSDTLKIGADVTTPGFDTKVGFTSDYTIVSGKRNGVETQYGGTNPTYSPSSTAGAEHSISVTDGSNPLVSDTIYDNLKLAVDGYLVDAGDFVTVKFTIKNGSDFNITELTAAATESTGSTTGVFEVTECKLTDSNGSTITNLPTNETATLTVTITMENNLQTAGVDTATGKFEITVIANTSN